MVKSKVKKEKVKKEKVKKKLKAELDFIANKYDRIKYFEPGDYSMNGVNVTIYKPRCGIVDERFVPCNYNPTKKSKIFNACKVKSSDLDPKKCYDYVHDVLKERYNNDSKFKCAIKNNFGDEIGHKTSNKCNKLREEIAKYENILSKL
jgi:hypothetical protein